MKTMTKLLTMLTCFALVLSMASVTAQASEVFEINDNGVLTRYNGQSAVVEIPDGVTAIGKDAFANCHITSVTIPDSVTSIGSVAFYGCDMESIVIPEGVTFIGESAFADCKKLVDVTIPDSVEEIDAYAFNYTPYLENLYDENGFAIANGHLLLYKGTETDVVVPDGVKAISPIAFDHASITSIVIPEGAVSIGSKAFWMCDDLVSVQLPSTLTEIGSQAFSDCYVLEQINLPEGMTTISGTLFSDCDSLTTVTIPSTVTSIGGAAFFNCDSLQSIEIPEGVTSIGKAAFQYCPSLTDLYIPYTVRSIYSYAVHDSPNVTLHVAPDSAGEEYATKYGFRYVVDMPARTIPEISFTDVADGAWYHDNVAWAVGEGVTTGTSQATFSPEDTCTRNQVVTFLWRAYGSPEPTSTENPFVDVKETDYFYKAVLWAAEKGITSGMDETHFGPNSPCTRGQVVTFLHRAEGKPSATAFFSNPFSDVSRSDYYYTPVQWAASQNITSGMDETHFAPDATCTRAQIVTFLFRCMTLIYVA